MSNTIICLRFKKYFGTNLTFLRGFIPELSMVVFHNYRDLALDLYGDISRQCQYHTRLSLCKVLQQSAYLKHGETLHKIEILWGGGGALPHIYGLVQYVPRFILLNILLPPFCTHSWLNWMRTINENEVGLKEKPEEQKDYIKIRPEAPGVSGADPGGGGPRVPWPPHFLGEKTRGPKTTHTEETRGLSA